MKRSKCRDTHRLTYRFHSYAENTVPAVLHFIIDIANEGMDASLRRTNETLPSV